MSQKKMNSDDLNSALIKTKQNIRRQASLAAIAVVTALILCFALTAAWYSNILHTSDLTFKAKEWNFVFEGNLKLNEGNIMAAPGESGIVTLSLANVSDEKNILGSATDISTIGVNVTIDKSEMGLLAPRVYFYVDKPYTLNEESVDRQYLSSTNGFLYTVYSGHTLQLSKEYSNDYPIHWEWVYDVVGYYVKGDMTDQGTIQNAEFLKPIVYNPDQAEYADDDTGRVKAVNSVPIKTFMEENYLSKDGYLGNTFEWYQESKYMQVSAEEKIWIYLCSEREIQDHNAVDTALAYNVDEETNEKPSYPARIVLTGQKANEQAEIISSNQDVVDKINSGYKLLEIQGDMTLSTAITVNAGTDVMIDLNGHTLTVDVPMSAQEGSSVGFMNGTITASKENVTLLNAVSTEIYMDNLKIEGFECGIEVFDKDGTEDSHIYLSQCDITTNNSFVWLRGNGDKSARRTTLIIENSKLTSLTYIPVGGNGTKEWYGTDIQILSSTLTGKYAAVFHPMPKSSMLIKNCTLIADTGVVVKGGQVTIENSMIQGTGPANEPKHSKSGFSETGDAVYVEDTYVNQDGREIEVIINGKNTMLKSTNAQAFRVFDGTTDKVFTALNAGKYSSDVTAYLPKDDSKIITKLSDGSWEINDKPADLKEPEPSSAPATPSPEPEIVEE